MEKMLLAIDIGNTQVVMGVFEGDKMKASWRITTLPHRTADECWTQVMAFCQTAGITVEKLTAAAISSVVPRMTASFERMVQERIAGGCEPFIFQPEEYPYISIRYDNPRSVGADRICNAVAGYAGFGGPLVIVDFGTATTFDVVGENGEYRGGIIAPGLETSSAELHRRAAKLVKVDLKFPPSAVGCSTETSIQSGIMFGALDMIDGLIRRIWREIGGECKAIATGGLAPVIVEKSETISQFVPFLVLDGLNRIYRKMSK